MNEQKKIAYEIEKLLALDRKVVGVKFVYAEGQLDESRFSVPEKPLSFCQAVRGASLGHEILLKREMGGCPGANRALGFCEVTSNFYSGESGFSLGLYKNEEVAKSVANDVAITEKETCGIALGPLDKFSEAPDVVIIFANPREMMRVMQGYTHVFGIAKNISLSGNQALCVETTATPLKTNDINISLLCSGTRFKAKWSDNELVCGLPYSMSEKLVEGLKGTVNAVEEDKRKGEIKEGLEEKNLLDFEIAFGRTYYDKKNEK